MEGNMMLPRKRRESHWRKSWTNREEGKGAGGKKRGKGRGLVMNKERKRTKGPTLAALCRRPKIKKSSGGVG